MPCVDERRDSSSRVRELPQGRSREGTIVTLMKWAWMRWLALIPLVVALPFLFFGLIWMQVLQLVVGVALLAASSGIWIVFAED